MATVPPPSRELEARILQKTVPDTAMTCEEFEELLTEYLDGFLPAHMYHRWERHAALCDSCTELPGAVVRSIGACYTYISEEKPVPAGLNERILHATLGTVTPQEIKAPWRSRARLSFSVVVGSDYVAAARNCRHDVAGGSAGLDEHSFGRRLDSAAFTTRVSHWPNEPAVIAGTSEITNRLRASETNAHAATAAEARNDQQKRCPGEVRANGHNNR
jgi:hypothetical protein